MSQRRRAILKSAKVGTISRKTARSAVIAFAQSNGAQGSRSTRAKSASRRVSKRTK